ncbi:MAG: hypothetical protein ACYDCG_02100 [Candidatus Acidiferrales bacterium]
MQFARAQGGGLLAVGLLLLALQTYILFFSTLQSGSPTQAPPAPTPGEQIIKFVPGTLGLLALAAGGYLILLQRKHGSNEETQPEKTKSGLPM